MLEHAKRDPHGHVAVAHLRRQDKDVWDAIVVAEDAQPLVFWAHGEQPDMKDLVIREDGSVMMVVISTPPGVQPAGLLVVPANAWGSPLATLVSVVSQEGLTMVSSAGDTESASPPPMGRDMLISLLDHAAARNEGGYAVTELETADGGTATVLLDWDGRPVMFWLEVPGDESPRTLMTAMASPDGDGLIAMAVDGDLRPLYSTLPPRNR